MLAQQCRFTRFTAQARADDPDGLRRSALLLSHGEAAHRRQERETSRAAHGRLPEVQEARVAAGTAGRALSALRAAGRPQAKRALRIGFNCCTTPDFLTNLALESLGRT
jgi:hypothetical protein